MEEFCAPRRLLLGPGPSNVHPRVLQAMATSLVGHLDQAFLAVMNDVQTRLRRLFSTANRLTIAVSGTGSAGMEAAVVNIVEPGDAVIVGVNGVFGTRLATIVERCGGKAIRIEVPWGQIIEPDLIEEKLRRSGPVKAVALVHAETSTGAWQPIEPMSAMCRAHDALLIVDAVTSLAGLPVEVDRWGIDVCYSATQKCLSCPPGLAPLTVNDRALSVIRSRRTPCQSWYFDLSLIADYWTEHNRAYHHTAPISMLYALRESLRIIAEEGLPARFARHHLNSRALMAGLLALGFDPVPPVDYRLPTLLCVTVPTLIDEGAVRAQLLERFDIEIGGGLGHLKGKVWRIGLMGESSTEANVLTLLNALEEIGIQNGWVSIPGIALQAAASTYSRGR
ncbi:MAG: alanine--glyoxylate aminotransferase family protein [Nitrospira sp.]|nr:alanine--glyoxylate aminotransferase family protein [Nitrospira sp.]MDR4469130.1 alanine--glyoxylate aminotransferase family protein [Nitrospira sp.]